MKSELELIIRKSVRTGNMKHILKMLDTQLADAEEQLMALISRISSDRNPRLFVACLAYALGDPEADPPWYIARRFNITRQAVHKRLGMLRDEYGIVAPFMKSVSQRIHMSVAQREKNHWRNRR